MKRNALVLLAILSAPEAALGTPTDGGTPVPSAEYRKDLAMFCDAESDSGAAEFADPARRADSVANYVVARHPGREFLELFEALGHINPIDKAPILMAAAFEAGLEGCALAESSQREAEASLELECKSRGNDEACRLLESTHQAWRRLLAQAPRPEVGVRDAASATAEKADGGSARDDGGHREDVGP